MSPAPVRCSRCSRPSQECRTRLSNQSHLPTRRVPEQYSVCVAHHFALRACSTSSGAEPCRMTETLCLWVVWPSLDLSRFELLLRLICVFSGLHRGPPSIQLRSLLRESDRAHCSPAVDRSRPNDEGQIEVFGAGVPDGFQSWRLAQSDFGMKQTRFRCRNRDTDHLRRLLHGAL